MRKLHNVLGLAILSVSLMGSVFAQEDHRDHENRDHDNHAYVEHKEWRKGEHLRHEDWDRGDRVDYHEHHLKPPPRGYEWRMVDGNYVLANSSNFQIRTVIRIP